METACENGQFYIELNLSNSFPNLRSVYLYLVKYGKGPKKTLLQLSSRESARRRIVLWYRGLIKQYIFCVKLWKEYKTSPVQRIQVSFCLVRTSISWSMLTVIDTRLLDYRVYFKMIKVASNKFATTYMNGKDRRGGKAQVNSMYRAHDGWLKNFWNQSVMRLSQRNNKYQSTH